MYLGSLVAAAQVLHDSLQNSHPLEKRKGGSQPLQSSIPEPNTQEHPILQIPPQDIL